MTAAATSLDVSPLERLSTYIPTKNIGEIGGLENVHLTHDSCLGFAWRLGVPCAESADGSEAFLADALDQLFRQLPVGYSLDIYINRGRDVAGYLNTYAASSGNTEFAQVMCQHKLKRWWDAKEEGFFPYEAALNFYPRSQSIYIFLKTAKCEGLVTNTAKSFLSWFKKGMEQEIERELFNIGVELRRRVHQLEQTATGRGLVLERLDGSEYVAFIGSLLFPQKGMTQMPELSVWDTPGETVSMLGEVPEILNEGFVTDVRGRKVYHRAVSMTLPPQAVLPGMFNSLVDEEVDITVHLSFLAQSRMQTQLKLKGAKHFNRKMATIFTETETEERNASYVDAETRMFNGENFGSTKFSVWVRGNSEQDVMDRATRVVGHLDCQMPTELESRIGSSVLLRSFPMGRHEVIDRSLSRCRQLLSNDAATMAPLGGYWQGTRPDRSMLLYPSRWGTPLFIDPRECDSNPHTLIWGRSGSGKSVLFHDLCLQLLRLPNVWMCVVSIKPDYERLARIVGNYVEINLDGDHSINPFGGAPTEDNLSNWVAILTSMLTEGDSRIIIDKEVQGMLSTLTRTASKMNWDPVKQQPIRETVLDHIINRLMLTELGRQLADKLKPYHTGQYSKLFNRPRTIQSSDRFTFFNLSKVLEYTCASVASLCIFNFVNSVMYDRDRLGTLKIFGLDEGWSMMKDEVSASLAQKGFRAFRSLNGMSIAISQMPSDFDTPIGKAILANTATKIVLPQDDTTLRSLSDYLSLSEKETRLIESLTLKKRYYGEFFVKMESGASTVGRLVPDPFTYAISTTEPTDTTIYNQLLKECHGDSWAAVTRFAKEYPNGMRIAA